VAKLSSDLGTRQAATFLGGSDWDSATALAIDGQGNVVVAGWTDSSDFPTTAGAYDATYNGGGDAFVAKLSSDLGTRQAATFLGGSSWDVATALAIDGQGTVVVAGWTYSSNFPTTAGAYDATHNGHRDAFVARLSSDLGTRQAATFLGGSDDDSATALALDGQGNVVVAGETESSDFPTTAGAYDATLDGFRDAFVARLSFTFDKTAPADGATNQPTTVTLQWQAVGSGVDHYRYCYDTTSGCTPTTSVRTNTSVTLSGLTPGATYFLASARLCR